MASDNYIPVGRVLEALPPNVASVAGNQALLDCLKGCSVFLDRFCNRSIGGFLTQNYDILLNGTGESLLFLPDTPVQSISRVATIDQPCLALHNTESSMGARCTVQVNSTPTNTQGNYESQNVSTGITLTYIKDALTTANVLTWASYPTVNDLAAGVTALGSKWIATVMGGFGSWSTTDIRGTQGAYGSRITTSYLWIHSFDLPWYRQNELTGEIYSEMGFARGSRNWRVQYTAGYEVFPDDLAQALAELTAATYQKRFLNPNYKSQNLGQYSYVMQDKISLEQLSLMSQKTIRSYKRHLVPQFSLW